MVEGGRIHRIPVAQFRENRTRCGGGDQNARRQTVRGNYACHGKRTRTGEEGKS